jgi:hypothetical protein
MKHLFYLLLLFPFWAMSQSGIMDPSKGVIPPSLTQVQRNAISSPENGSIIYCSNCATGAGLYTYRNAAWQMLFGSAPSYAIGQTAFGGKIFYIDPSGQHGLVAATADLAASRWFNGDFIQTMANGNGVYSGQLNTELIINSQGGSNFAALNAASYTVSGQGEWFLPSIEELKLMRTQKVVIGGFANAIYWSSSDLIQSANPDNKLAYSLDFTAAAAEVGSAKNIAYRIRPIKRF